MFDSDYQEGLIRDEPQPRIVGASHGCMYGYAMLLYAALLGLAIGGVIMLVVLFVPWIIPLATVGYLVWQWTMRPSRGRTKR